MSSCSPTGYFHFLSAPRPSPLMSEQPTLENAPGILLPSLSRLPSNDEIRPHAALNIALSRCPALLDGAREWRADGELLVTGRGLEGLLFNMIDRPAAGWRTHLSSV